MTAGRGARAADATAPTSFGLEGPTIVKADWESMALRVGDVNGDALTDFITVNNSKSLLQFFLQEQKGTVRRFEKREEALDYSVVDLALADFNGDGRPDLAVASRNQNVELRYQDEDGKLAPPVTVEVQGGLLVPGDVDRDGKQDLLIIEGGETHFLYGPEKEGLETAKPTRFFCASSPGSRPVLCDLDGNGLGDLIYLDSKRRNTVVVRFQTAPREWGLETGFEITDSVDIEALEPARKETAKADGESRAGQTAPALLATIHAKTREIRLYRYEAEAEKAGKLPLAGPYYLSSDPRSQSDRESLVACDLTGDGRTDLLAASPRAAEIGLCVQDERGGLSARTAPALVDISALASVERPTSGALVFSLSGQEETIGVSAWDAARGLSVPQLLDADYKPRAMAVADLDGSGRADLIYLFQDDNNRLHMATIIDPSDPSALRAEPTTHALPSGLEDEPVGMMADDVNGDGRCDLLVFSRYDPLRLLLQKEDGEFESFATDQGMKKGIFNKVRPAQIALADLDGDGKNEMLIARENFVRAYRLTPDGALEVAEQLNGKSAAARISSVAVANLDGEGPPEVVLLDTANKVLTLFAQGESGAYALVRHHDAEGISGARLLGADLNGDGQDDLVVYEGGRPQVFYSGRGSPKLKSLWRRVPEEKEGKYARIQPVELLDGSAFVQLLALEGTENLLELFRLPEPSGAGPDQVVSDPERFFHFKVFDDEKSAARNRDLRGRTLPRAVETADVDGDGLRDLVLLLHDNILYYTQSKGTAGE